MICPECNAEYVLGVSRCADCDVALIASPPGEHAKPLEPAPVWVRFGQNATPDELGVITSALDAAAIPYQIQGEHAGTLLSLRTVILVPSDRFEEAQLLAGTTAEVNADDMAAPEDTSRIPDTHQSGWARVAVEPVKDVPASRQGYWYGWVFAVMELSYLLPTGSQARNDVATYLAVLPSAVLGVAALAVTPWAWYVLVYGVPTHFVTASLMNWRGGGAVGAWPASLRVRSFLRLGFFVVGLALAVLTLVYFYRRRAMFGAARRWTAVERWWPGIAGPHFYIDRRTGFLSLTVRGRLLFILFMLALNVLNVMAP